jgi:carbon-monoxide dehydrogenase medium subunit
VGTLDQAVALLGEQKETRLLAGGQSLIATLNMRLSAPALLIDINGISGLDGIALSDGKNGGKAGDKVEIRTSSPDTRR